MDTKLAKTIGFAVFFVIAILIAWYAINVVLLAFAALLLAILLIAIGSGTKKITHLPYPFALILSLIGILGILTLTFWLYSPVIADQFTRLMNQLPSAVEKLRENLTPYLGKEFLSQSKLKEELSFSNQKLLNQLLFVFSSTIGSVIGFIIFLIVGLYLALDPYRYVRWVLLLAPAKKRERVWGIMEKIGQSLRWWILGKLLSMIVVGIFTFIGLRILDISLAFILGFLAGILTFIPYVGPILASIPAILIAFTQSPLLALYVIILYLGIHLVEGYFITPFIEQRTVSIPPAMTIMAQVLMTVLVGGFGLALTTPLIVVAIAVMQYSSKQRSLKVAKQT